MSLMREIREHKVILGTCRVKCMGNEREFGYSAPEKKINHRHHHYHSHHQLPFITTCMALAIIIIHHPFRESGVTGWVNTAEESEAVMFYLSAETDTPTDTLIHRHHRPIHCSFSSPDVIAALFSNPFVILPSVISSKYFIHQSLNPNPDEEPLLQIYK